MDDPIRITRTLKRSRPGPEITVNTYSRDALLVASSDGSYIALHLSAEEVLRLVEILSESALLVAKEEVAA